VSERIAFEAGLAEAADPANAASVAGGHAVTTLRSRWLHLPCPLCRHTFRLGDEVDLGSDGVARHGPAVRVCGRRDACAVRSDAEAAEFFTGLEETWPPPPGLPVRRLALGHPLLAPPYAGFRRHTCAVCGHTLRPGDAIVRCPCSPSAPVCQVAIHRDPVQGLHCWDAWNPGGYLRYCPATSRKLDE
jgi:hypothetical protein